MIKGTMLQYFHWYLPNDGNLWNQIKSEASRLKGLGFSTIWLPPAYKGADGAASIGYDVYDLYDFGEFDQKGTVRTKYGTKQEYFDAIEEIHKVGMRVMVDIVFNHKTGGDGKEKITVVKVDPENRTKVISAPFEIEAFTKFTFPGRQKKYSAFEWTSRCFDSLDYADDLKETGIFKIENGYGDSFQNMISDEKGNYDFLMGNDIDFRNPAVREELQNWGKWYWDQVHFDAVRLDAVKHITPEFSLEWLNKLRENTNTDIFGVGEYWAPGHLDLLMKYIEKTHGIMSLFDSSLHNNFRTASTRGNEYDMRNILHETLMESFPEKAVTVVANHDTQPLQSLEAVVEAWFKPLAYALILLREQGYPCVFYPDLYGAHYKDKDKQGNEQEIWMQKVENIEKLLLARYDYAYGTQRDYFDHPNCIGWTREGDEQHSGCAILLSNGDNGNKFMEIGQRYAGKYFIDLLQKNTEEVEINKDGWGNFFAPAGSLSVWIEKIK